MRNPTRQVAIACGRLLRRTLAIASLLAPAAAARAACPAVSAGLEGTSLALKSDGTVWSWGQNSNGELGNGTQAHSTLPVQVLDPSGSGPFTGAAGIAAGFFHSMAVGDDGSVWGWGRTEEGELAIGPDPFPLYRTLPVPAMDAAGQGVLGGMTAVAGGVYLGTALGADGMVWNWGPRGGLGNDDSNQTGWFPVQVEDSTGKAFLTGVVAIARTDGSCLAVKDDGTAWLWPTAASALPQPVQDASGSAPLTGVAAVATGARRFFALKTDGTLWGWGDNFDGELGDGTDQNQRPLPVQVLDASGTAPLTGVVAVAAGDFHTLAVKSDGTLWAWGQGLRGQLGQGAGAITFTNLPVQVKDATGNGFLAGVVAASAGKSYSLALQADGSVWAFGMNLHGALGIGTTDDAYLPARVPIDLGTACAGSPVKGLRLVKRGDDVVLSWSGSAAGHWRLARDARKEDIGETTIVPDTTEQTFVDAQRVAFPASDLYAVEAR